MATTYRVRLTDPTSKRRVSARVRIIRENVHHDAGEWWHEIEMLQGIPSLSLRRGLVCRCPARIIRPEVHGAGGAV